MEKLEACAVAPFRYILKRKEKNGKTEEIFPNSMQLDWSVNVPQVDSHRAPTENWPSDSVADKVERIVSEDEVAKKGRILLISAVSHAAYEALPEIHSYLHAYLQDSLSFYNATPSESERIESVVFGDQRGYWPIRFFHNDPNSFGEYQAPFLQGEFRSPDEYISKTLEDPGWGLFLDIELIGSTREGQFWFDDTLPNFFRLTLRHELDHLVLHVLTIFRKFRNSDQFHQETRDNPFFLKKMELNAFFQQANLAMELKEGGWDISEEEILSRHTGWNADGEGFPECYRGVWRGMRLVMETSIFLYELCKSYETNAVSDNRNAAAVQNRMEQFETFRRSLAKGFEAMQSEEEMKAFLSFIGTLYRGLSRHPKSFLYFSMRILSAPSEIRMLPSYLVFKENFERSI